MNADDQGLNKDILVANEAYKEFKKIIKIQLTDTNKLLVLYYQEMINIQNSLKGGDCGTIYIRAYYHTKDETLCVEGLFYFYYNFYYRIVIFYFHFEVVKCKSLIPMDQNGLSDPVSDKTLNM